MKVPILALALALAACIPEPVQTQTPKWVSDTSSYGGQSHPAPTLADRYREPVAKILAAARADRGAYAKLEQLTDHVGHRLAGSPELDRAIAWASQTMQADGLVVHTEKVMVPHWVRGPEDGALVTPVARPLHLLGVGDSVATPKGGIIAPVVVVHSWQELDAKQAQVKGAIVLFDVPMPAWTPEHGSGYGVVFEYRVFGPSRAAKYGAVATLMRALTEHSLSTPHTGTLLYDDKQPKIPSAEVTLEDADLLDRLAAQGPVTVHLHLESQMLPDAPSANVIGELRGREKPDEIVVIGGHLDSWDVGQGAQDDGGGVVMMMEAVHVLKQLGLVPRRTIRVVAFTNEENGTRGATAYAADHRDELAHTVFALESDSGAYEPRGFVIDHADAASLRRMNARLAELAPLLAPLGATRLIAGKEPGTDVGKMKPGGVPLAGLLVDNRTYFDIHHTDADTLDKVDPQQLADDVAAVAALVYVVAELPDRIDAP